MKNHVHVWTLSFVVAGVSIPAGGCSDPKYKSRQATREQSMSQVMSWYAAHEAGGPARMKRIKQLNEDAEEWHKKQLEEMHKRIDVSYRRDYKRWNDNRQQREGWLKAAAEGKPGEIPDTWAKMVYP